LHPGDSPGETYGDDPPTLCRSAGLLALALFVLRASGRCESNQWFASFAACAAAWTFGICGRQWGTALQSWNDLVFASGVLLPAYSSFGPYLGIVLIALIVHTIIRHRLMDLRLAIPRRLIVSIAAVAVLGPVTMLVLVTWPRLAGRLDFPEEFVLIGAVVAAGLITPVARDGAAKLLDRYAYRTHADYEHTVREASAALTRVRNVNELVVVLTRTLRDTLAPGGIAMYMAESSGLRHVVSHCPESARFDCPAELSPRLTSALESAKDAIAVDDPAGARVDGGLYAELREANWAVVLPFVAENALIGAICLGPKLCRDPFYHQDINLLMTVVNQAAVALNNAQRYAAICAR
jgi:GAF domain-containing protein